MKTIGLIGGMSWESSAEYYRTLNTLIKERLGGLHSAKLILHSVDFAEIESLQRYNEWEKAGEQLAKIAQNLEVAGADVILLATNTMHKIAEQISSAISLPFLHIGDAVSRAITLEKLDTVGLLGTRYTMEQDFYRARLQSHGLKVIVLDFAAREELNRIIFEELCLGKVEKKSAQALSSMVGDLEAQGARGLILGCTELGMLSEMSQFKISVFDSTQIHCKAALDFVLA